MATLGNAPPSASPGVACTSPRVGRNSFVGSSTGVNSFIRDKKDEASMFQGKPECVEQDLKVQAALDRKRQAEEERKARIFNPRARKIGIDKEFLDRQVEEKRRQEELERQQDYRLDEVLIRSSNLAMLLERRQNEEKRKLNQELNEYRRDHQKPELSRDFDLYDPESLRKSRPLREDDDDEADESQLGPASAQKFEGEDRNLATRQREQKEQMQAWIRQQLCEKKSVDLQRLALDREYDAGVRSRTARATALETMERDCRRGLAEANARFNRALAEEKEQRRRCESAQELEDERAEIYNHVTGDFLTESKDQARSNRGPGRPLANRYKGMTSDQLKIFRDEQAKQAEEIHRLRLEEEARNEEWNRLMTGNARAAESYQRDLDRKKAEMNRKIAEENLLMAQRQKNQQDYLNQHVYKNQPSSEFYSQFNRSTR